MADEFLDTIEVLDVVVDRYWSWFKLSGFTRRSEPLVTQIDHDKILISGGNEHVGRSMGAISVRILKDAMVFDTKEMTCRSLGKQLSDYLIEDLSNRSYNHYSSILFIGKNRKNRPDIANYSLKSNKVTILKSL